MIGTRLICFEAEVNMRQQTLILFLQSRDFSLKRFNIYVHINQVVKHVSNGGFRSQTAA